MAFQFLQLPLGPAKINPHCPKRKRPGHGKPNLNWVEGRISPWKRGLPMQGNTSHVSSRSTRAGRMMEGLATELCRWCMGWNTLLWPTCLCPHTLYSVHLIYPLHLCLTYKRTRSRLKLRMRPFGRDRRMDRGMAGGNRRYWLSDVLVHLPFRR